MAPGTDAVTTGIVKLENGQSVKIYARNDSQPDPDTPNVDKPADTNQPKRQNNTLMLIVTIVGAVVFLALVVVAVLIVLKKPADKEEKTKE